MSIAARNAMLAGGDISAKSYVQDGLVAMWDGQWNAGPGVHDPNATVWVDCVNGWEFTPTGTVGETVVFDTNKVTLSGGESYLMMGTNNWNGQSPWRTIVQGSGNTANFTVEHCNAPAFSAKTGARYFVIGGRREGGAIYGAFCYSMNGRTINYGNVKGTLLDIPQMNTSRSMWTIVFQSEGTTCRSYTNAVLKATGTNGSSTAWWDGWMIGHGNVKYGYWEGDVFCHRLYNRSLSADELAHNYAVDKKRFGL